MYICSESYNRINIGIKENTLVFQTITTARIAAVQTVANRCGSILRPTFSSFPSSLPLLLLLPMPSVSVVFNPPGNFVSPCSSQNPSLLSSHAGIKLCGLLNTLRGSTLVLNSLKRVDSTSP